MRRSLRDIRSNPKGAVCPDPRASQDRIIFQESGIRPGVAEITGPSDHGILDWVNEQYKIRCPEGLSPKSSAGNP
jgi:hypothetical protein